MDVIYSINGPVVTVKNSKSFAMLEMVYVGNLRLIGEVIMLSQQQTTIQVYEDTAGLSVGEPVTGSGGPLCALLGPGIISNIFDGIERPLKALNEKSGAFLDRGISCDNLDTERLWDVKILVGAGDSVSEGQIFAQTPENEGIMHKSMIPPGISGKVISAAGDGSYNILTPLITVEDKKGIKHEIALAQKWPIKYTRPSSERLSACEPLVTGQRVIDTLFPIAKGGAAAVPGSFGTGKTMVQHQIAKWSDADIIVYIGCGERGNEMTQVLEEFSELRDPKTGRALTERTVMIANTSNMPVAAREASIYTGVTLAEYYRDMGYHVAIMADSTSRWAEALREISGRLEEMPAEEGFPSYLPSRLSKFYERAGYVQTLSGKKGSVTIIGAVSPQGGDFSEPVTQNTKRFIRCFWALDRELAYSRHYPAINWITSYTEYFDELREWYGQNVCADFESVRSRIIGILLEENRLMEIVKLIGEDVLPEDQKLIIVTAKAIRQGFLQQNAMHDTDTYVPLEKQYDMMKLILDLYDKAMSLVKQGIPLSRISQTGVFDAVMRVKFEIKNDELEKFGSLTQELSAKLENLEESYR